MYESFPTTRFSAFVLSLWTACLATRSFFLLTLEPANEKEPEKLIYVPFGEKNNLGGLKHRSFKQKRIEHYANTVHLIAV